MARAMAPRVGRAAVRVMPFVAARFADAAREHLAGPRRDASFLYPADASAHKNHPNLLRAWALLEAEGIAPPLALTLPPESLTMVLAAAGLTAAPRSVRNLGPVPHAEVLAMFAARHALVFPSTAETFGLPLIEAASAGTAIVASERDFVRDVCMPDQSFDPASPASIAAAVRRHMGIPAPLHPLLDARRFVEALLA
jgi:glycosyltransferase involved in cell wall biosynthesis